MNIDTRTIRAEPHTEVGTLIQRDGAVIVERWCRRAVEEQPDARRVHYDVLRDQLPAFVQSMGRNLANTGSPQATPHPKSALEHGEQRWDSGWSLTELVRDYQILQLVILEHLDETLARPMTYREIMAVGVFLNDAIAASTVAYVAHRDAHVHQIDRERADALQEASRRKDEFIAGLAHELRNPLAPIVNSVKVLQLLLPNADTSVVQTIEVVERQTKQMTRLVDDLLDLARIAQGKFELRRTHLDLRMVLEQAVQMSEPALKARNHRLAVAIPAEPLHLEADPARLVQVVVNLLTNAAKYTQPNGQLGLTVMREPGAVLILVRDNGMGIPPEMLSRVFDMFVQVESARPNSQGGLGIGLTLVRRLVELHGGTVTCLSGGIGKGSEFIVRLPLRADAAPESPPKRETAPVLRRHVLIVEDEADSRDSLAILLRIAGHQVDVAESGARGLEKAAVVRPEVAFIDIGLPDVDGYEVARSLRATRGDSILLVALTGYGQTDDLRRALDAGFDAHLVKPADLDELARVLARVPSAD